MNLINVKLMIDGNFTFHIHKYLISKFNKHIDWKAFITFIKAYIKNLSKNNNIQIAVDAKYFIGTKTITDDHERDYFYNSMDHANISKKANKLKSIGELGLKEDAVDVSLAVTAISDYYQSRDENRYSYFILFAGDSDFVPLISELKSLGVKTVLVYIDFSNGNSITKTGQALLEEVDERIDFQTILSERVDPLKKEILQTHSDEIQYPYLSSATKFVVSWDIIRAAIDNCKHSSQGFVLGADLGKSLQAKLGLNKLPKGLKGILEDYSENLDFLPNPYQVRLKSRLK